MQATLMDDQRRKTISAIHSSNTSLALKHWSLILKYLPKDPSEALSTLIKEAYNGVPEVLVNLADFLGATSICSGWTTLYSEMHNYGHVFGGKDNFKIISGRLSDLYPSRSPLHLPRHPTPSPIILPGSPRPPNPTRRDLPPIRILHPSKCGQLRVSLLRQTLRLPTLLPLSRRSHKDSGCRRV